jgi:hypothetical protein
MAFAISTAQSSAAHAQSGAAHCVACRAHCAACRAHSVALPRSQCVALPRSQWHPVGSTGRASATWPGEGKAPDRRFSVFRATRRSNRGAATSANLHVPERRGQHPMAVRAPILRPDGSEADGSPPHCPPACSACVECGTVLSSTPILYPLIV